MCSEVGSKMDQKSSQNSIRWHGEHSKCINLLITGYIVVKCYLSPQCTHHVPTGYMGPCPQCVLSCHVMVLPSLESPHPSTCMPQFPVSCAVLILWHHETSAWDCMSGTNDDSKSIPFSTPSIPFPYVPVGLTWVSIKPMMLSGTSHSISSHYAHKPPTPQGYWCLLWIDHSVGMQHGTTANRSQHGYVSSIISQEGSIGIDNLSVVGSSVGTSNCCLTNMAFSQSDWLWRQTSFSVTGTSNMGSLLQYNYKGQDDISDLDDMKSQYIGAQTGVVVF